MLHTIENSILEVAKSVSVEQGGPGVSVFSRHWRRLIIRSCLGKSHAAPAASRAGSSSLQTSRARHLRG